MFGQAAGGIVGDYFGWRTMFFLLAAMLALAAAALSFELATNAITRADKSAPGKGGLFAGYAVVLRNPWARTVLVVIGLEGALFQGVFPYVSADLHLRFGLSFTAIGLIIGIFATGGLIYAATVKTLMRRIGQLGIAKTGGVLMGFAFLTLAVEPVWQFAPLATLGIGLGFFMLHNTLQTEATQMTPEARATSVALFASMYFLGQTLGVALAAPVMDSVGARPLFATSAVLLPVLAFVFTARLKRKGLS
jgi:predicted MFS family arabinose efflux permease